MGVVTSCILNGLIFSFLLQQKFVSRTWEWNWCTGPRHWWRRRRRECASGAAICHSDLYNWYVSGGPCSLQIQKLRSPVLGTQSYQTSPHLNLGDSAWAQLRAVYAFFLQPGIVLCNFLISSLFSFILENSFIPPLTQGDGCHEQWLKCLHVIGFVIFCPNISKMLLFSTFINTWWTEIS